MHSTRLATIASAAALGLVAAALSSAVPAVATSATPPAAPPAAAAPTSAELQAREKTARAAQDAIPTEAQRLAVARRTGETSLAVSTGSIAAMAKVQKALAASKSSRVKASAAVGAAITPHYFGPYGNYANSPEHLPTALVEFSAPANVPGARRASGTVNVSTAGVVTGVTITDPGAGYVKTPYVYITSVGYGSGATATAALTGTVGSLTLLRGGLGYNSPVSVAITGGGGRGAAARATIDVHGTIDSLVLTSHGSGYTSAPLVRFTDGVGDINQTATAQAVLARGVGTVTIRKGGSGYVTPGLRKFVDTLPVLGSVGAQGTNPVTKNDLGQYIPVGIPDTTTYPGSDYYEIAVVQYRERLHKDLPAAGSLLRGYVQLSTATIPGKHVALYNDLLNGTRVAVKLPNGDQAYAVDVPHYLGPVIGATKGRPVRVLFRDLLPTGVSGDLFLPVDTTIMGSGSNPDGVMTMANLGIGSDMQNPECGKTPKPAGCYAENRATIHLHGGLTPWISDGTPHQWITPAGETTDYPKGVSVQNVPDMPDPGPGAQTFFYTNQQSARLLFYHDHSWGITRLNVYAGEASGYVITDDTEKALVASGTIPDGASTLPLIIEDKTFVPSTAQLSVSDPTWDVAQWGGEGNLWMPHVYMTAQNAQDISGVNQFGRWMYGPWFWPPTNDITAGLITNPYAGKCIAGTDWCEPSSWSKIPGVPNESMSAEAFQDTPVVNGTAYPTMTVDPKSYRMRILNAANDRFWNLSLFKATGKNNTEVALVAKDVAAGKTDPNVEPQVDTSISTPGPSWVQIGTEGGFLPTPAVIPPSSIGYITDPTVFDFGNINKHSLLLGPAERADVIVDFSKYAGQTLILYNDAPAAAPARDPRYDYYTDDADLRSTGGSAPTPEGYGPNTRTIMQIKVAAATPAAPFDMTKLMTAFTATSLGGGGVFQNSQHPILVGQQVYNNALGTSFGSQSTDGKTYDGYMRMTATTLTFNTLNGASATNAGQVMVKNTTSVAMHDEMGAAFDKVYGRMSGSMGVEAPATTAGTQQNLTLYPYVNPPTEEFLGDDLPPGDTAVQVATTQEYGDNVQIWKITHNGVDTHPIHFHLADVQLVNRVSWDGIIRVPDANELGWKDTVRVNPLSDTIVAIRPIIPQAPFGIAVSMRSPNPAMPVGMSDGFVQTDPAGNNYSPAITNQVMNFGWEYVWHCHILSHEEMDMMRPIKVDVPVSAPDQSTPWFTRTGGITVVWTDPTPANPTGAMNTSWGNPKSEIGFHIQRAPLVDGEPGTFVPIGEALANQTQFTDPLGNTAQYAYRVVAWNASGATTGTPRAAIDPAGAPEELQAVAGITSAVLSWGIPADGPLSGSPITGYAIQISSDNGATWTDAVTNTGSTSPTYTVTGLLTRGPYVFRAAAIHVAGTGDWSIASEAVAPKIAPSAVSSVSGTPGNARVALAWPAPNDGGLPISHYSVQSSSNGGTTWTTPVSTGSGDPHYTVVGLTNGVHYVFQVSATNDAGTSPWSASSGTLIPFTTASAPTRLRAVPGMGRATLTWVRAYDGGAPITGYEVDYRQLPGRTWKVLVRNTHSGAPTTVVTKLGRARTYVFVVRPINAAGVGHASGQSARITTFTVPGRPTLAHATSGPSRVTVWWTPPATGGSPILGYRFLLSTDNGKTWFLNPQRAKQGTTWWTITGLRVTKHYQVKVIAFNSGGAGTPSAPTANAFVY
jgi:FtsP/CotA-like multicopper oxidase with cupredoxin domain